MSKYFRTAVAALTLSIGFAAAVPPARAEDKKDAPKAAESVDFRKLKELMPAELGGLKRTSNNGEKNKIGELSITQVSANYGKDDDEGKAPRIEVQVIDYSSTQMAQGLAAAWTLAEIDKESDDGFEKTQKFAGQPGRISWQKEGKHGEVQVLVGGRYVVTVNTYNVASDQLAKIAEALPLAKIAELKSSASRPSPPASRRRTAGSGGCRASSRR
jgi:hypothetical protein